MQNLTIEIDNELDPDTEAYEAFDVDVYYSIEPYRPARMFTRDGDVGHDEEGGDVEYKITRDGKPVEVSDKWLKVIIDKCYRDNGK